MSAAVVRTTMSGVTPMLSVRLPLARTARFVAMSGLTNTNESIGTPAYMSPEQIDGSPVDGRADIYALGCVLHHALTGEEPFPRQLPHEVYGAHLHADPPIPSACNSILGTGFDAVVLQALAKAPSNRFPNCADFEAACREALGRSAGTTPADGDAAALEISIPTDVLVWQQGDERPLIHRSTNCLVLVDSVVPPPTIKFAGSGTAGWLPFREAVAQPDAALCRVCIGG